ncbi:MAG TPA: ABC transporter ATP-binding protein [Candidatus Saccharimonadales bacterium]|jgi:ATP-binding cassette subfamily B protein|nr:ABC transporter ATP-binding protein [Candidatus Saccharimonadales bacterium]
MSGIFRIFKFTKVLWPYYAGVSAFAILVAAMSQAQPLLTKPAIDQITKLIGGAHANIKLVAFLAVLIFLTDVGQTLFSNIGGYMGDMLSAKLQRFMSQRYYEHILSLPQRYFDTELSGKIINRMSRGITQIGTFMQVVSNNFLQFIFSAVFSLVIVVHYSWPVALMLFSLYPIFVFLTTRMSNKWQSYQQKINLEQDIASGRFAESIGQVRVVKSFLQEARELKFFQSRFDAVVKTTRPQSRFWHRQDALRRLVLNVIFLGVFVFTFVETARGAYSISTMVLIIQYAMLMRIPIFSISYLVDNTQRAVANAKDYFEVLDVEPEIIDHEGAKKLRVAKGDIVFDDVSFAYDADKPVLRNVNVHIEPDTKVALVGESGEGKTTLTNLLLRLYEVTDGQIRIDNQNINDVTQSSLRGNVGIVFQEPALFSGTIRENIAYAHEKATDAEIITAAKAANAHEFIRKFEHGYDTEIGERGLKLSGGQKQRIAIARALLKDAPILILDEATSSLDSKSEHMVQEALEHLMKGRTTLIIAHRLSTIQNVDQIVTLRGGRVDEVGSPKELAKTNGIYAQLLQLQQGHTAATKKKLKEFEIAA